MAGDRRVADLAGERRARGSGPGPCAGRATVVPSTTTWSTPIFGMRIIADGSPSAAAAAPRAGRSSWWWSAPPWCGVVVGGVVVVAGLAALRSQLLVELVLEVVLGPGLVDAGAPQLVGDEQQDQQPEGDQRPADRRRRPFARTRAALTRTGWFALVTGPSYTPRSAPRAPEGPVAPRRPAPLRRLPARSLPGPRRRRSRRRRGRDRAALGRERRGQDHAAAARRRPACRSYSGRRRSSATISPRTAAAARRRASRSSATRLLLRRPDRPREPAVRRPGGPASPSTRPTPRSSGSGSTRSRRRRAPPPVGRAAPPARARGRARPGAPSCCCSTSRTPGSTPRAATCSTRWSRAAPAEGRTVLLASHELDVARALPARGVVADGRLVRRSAASSPAVSASRDDSRLPDATSRGRCRRGEPVARGVAGGGQGPADRGAGRGSCSPDPAVRRHRAAAVRVRARPDRGLLPGVAPGLFWVAVLLAALLAVSRSFAIEAAERRARRAAAVGARRRRDLPRQGRGDRGRAARPRGRARRRAWSCSTASSRLGRCCWCWRRWPRPSASRPPVPSTACSLRAAGARDAGAGAAAPGGGAGDARCHPGLGGRRSTASRRTGGRGSGCSRCSRCCTRRSGCWPSGRSWRKS